MHTVFFAQRHARDGRVFQVVFFGTPNHPAPRCHFRGPATRLLTLLRLEGKTPAGISFGEGGSVVFPFGEGRLLGIPFGEGVSAGFPFGEPRQKRFRQNRPRQTHFRQTLPRQARFQQTGSREARFQQETPRQTENQQIAGPAPWRFREKFLPVPQKV